MSADRIFCVRSIDRIRQLRGVSLFASVLTRFDDLKDYEESERIAAKVAASMAAYIKKGAPDDYTAGTGFNPDGSAESVTGLRDLKFRPGMIFDDLRPGEEIGLIDTKRPNPNLLAYRGGQMRAIASGTGTSYSSISKSYDGTYSAQRQELVDGWPNYATLSAEFTSRIVRPVYERFIATAIAAGTLKIPAGIVPESIDDAIYGAPQMPWINPEDEAAANFILEASGFESGPSIIRRRGQSPADVLRQESRWRRKADEVGLHFAPFDATAPVAPPAPALTAKKAKQ